MFYNIDGNKSNFYTFSDELSMPKVKYSVIAQAETNTGQDRSNLYQRDNYCHFYSNKSLISQKVYRCLITHA